MKLLFLVLLLTYCTVVTRTGGMLLTEYNFDMYIVFDMYISVVHMVYFVYRIVQMQ